MGDYLPSIVSPVWYGAEGFVTTTGAQFRVLYPALPVAIASPRHPAVNPTLYRGIGKYKIVVFVHGQGTTYRSWDFVLSELARSGCIVIIPETNGVSVLHDDALDVPLRALAYVIENPASPFRDILNLTQIGYCGHSYGAPIAAKPAIDSGNTSVYASIAGAFVDSISNTGHPDITAMFMPKLFIVGGDDDVDPVGGGFDLVVQSAGDRQLWDQLPIPKHNLNFLNAPHFAYVQANAPGLTKATPSPCSLIPALTSDFLALFFSRYMPPLIDDSFGVFSSLALVPGSNPPVDSYTVGFLGGLSQILRHPSCSAISTWDLPPIPPSSPPDRGFAFFGVP